MAKYRRAIKEYLFTCSKCNKNSYYNNTLHNNKDYKCEHCSSQIGKDGKFAQDILCLDISKPDNFEYKEIH